jgi:hypothetical protein
VNRINVGRVLLGGLLAGLVVNLGEYALKAVFLEDLIKLMKEEFPMFIGLVRVSGKTISVGVALNFTLGIAIVYLYAMIRPRSGPGLRSAIWAGVIAWFFIHFYVGLSYHVIGTMGLTLFRMVWGLFECVIAAITGARVYRESHK